MYYGAIEAGGTKFVCAGSNENFEIIDRINTPTMNPNQTIQQVHQFFKQYAYTVSFNN